MSTDSIPIAHKTDVAIQQLNLGYNADQDRLLLRVGLSDQSELAAWVTYRIAREIWSALNAEANMPSNKPIKVDDNVPEHAVKQFKQEVKAAKTLQKLDFATEYQARENLIQEGPLLINAINLQEQDKQLTLQMGCLGGFNIALNLNHESILAICNMLQLTSKEAGWDIGASAVATSTLVMLDTPGKQVMH